MHSSLLGAKLFSTAAVTVLHAAIAEKTEEFAASCFEPDNVLTEQRYLHCLRQAQDAVADMDEKGIIVGTRSVQCHYRGVEIPIEVSSLAQEIQARFECKLRGVATEQKKLPKLWGEDVLVNGAVHGEVKTKVPEQMLAAATQTRAAISQKLQDSGANSSDTTAQSLDEIFADQSLSDPFCVVEFSLLRTLTGKNSEDRILKEILSKMPDEKHHSTPEQLMQYLIQLQSKELYRLSARGAQSKLTHAIQLLECVIEGREPSVDAALKDENFLAIFLNRFQYFPSVIVAAPGQKGAKRNQHGMEALNQLLKSVEEKINTSACTQEDIQKILPYTWLFVEKDRKRARAAHKAFQDAEQAASSKGPTAKAKARGETPKEKSKRDSAVASAMAMFINK